MVRGWVRRRAAGAAMAAAILVAVALAATAAAMRRGCLSGPASPIMSWSFVRDESVRDLLLASTEEGELAAMDAAGRGQADDRRS